MPRGGRLEPRRRQDLPSCDASPSVQQNMQHLCYQRANRGRPVRKYSLRAGDEKSGGRGGEGGKGGRGKTKRPSLAMANRRHRDSLILTVRTAWPATRPPHSFLEFRAHALDVLPSSFRFLDGDDPADPLIAREWRNILPPLPRHRIGNENLPQIWRYAVYRASGDRFPGHGFHSTSSRNQSGEFQDGVRIGSERKGDLDKRRGNCGRRKGPLSSA